MTGVMRIALVLLFVAGSSVAQTAHEIYGKACINAIGPVPSFDCATGVLVPVTIDAIPVTDHAPAECDHPALLDNGAGSEGQCVPFSRILNLSTTSSQISVMCRQKQFRSASATGYDEIDVIAHNPATGATCWFQAKAEPGDTVSGAAVPSPTSATNNSFWQSPEIVVRDGCGTCHDNDPFMYSPFVGQVWAHVPVNPFGPYGHVDAGFGFSQWPTTAMNMRDSTCTGCHRIGSGSLISKDDDGGLKPGTCGALAAWMTGLVLPVGSDAWASRYPGSRTMPPVSALSEDAWTVIHGASASLVQTCCADPTQEICGLTEIRAYLDQVEEQ